MPEKANHGTQSDHLGGIISTLPLVSAILVSAIPVGHFTLVGVGMAIAALFGSIARNAQRPDSDIDIMVEIAPEANIGLYQYVGIINYLEDLFPIRVDVANREGLKPFVRPSAERDAIYAF